MAPRARRVEDHRVGPRPHRVEHVLRLPFDELHVADAGCVLGGVADRGGGLLDGDDPLRGTGQEDGERPDSRVGVDDHFTAGKPQRLANKRGESLRLLGVHLEERRRGYTELATKQLLRIVALTRLQRNILALQLGLNKPLVGVNPIPDGQLARFPRPPLEAVCQSVDSRGHQHALVRLHEPARDPIHEAGAALTPDREPRVIPIAEQAWRRYARFDVGLPQGLVIPEVPFNVPPLEDELMTIQNMLPLAPGAGPEVLARRGNPMGRRHDDLMHDAGNHPLPPPPIPHDPCDHMLTGNTPEHVDAPVLEVRETVPKRAYLVEKGQFREFRGLVVGP